VYTYNAYDVIVARTRRRRCRQRWRGKRRVRQCKTIHICINPHNIYTSYIHVHAYRRYTATIYIYYNAILRAPYKLRRPLRPRYRAVKYETCTSNYYILHARRYAARLIFDVIHIHHVRAAHSSAAAAACARIIHSALWHIYTCTYVSRCAAVHANDESSGRRALFAPRIVLTRRKIVSRSGRPEGRRVFGKRLKSL